MLCDCVCEGHRYNEEKERAPECCSTGACNGTFNNDIDIALSFTLLSVHRHCQLTIKRKGTEERKRERDLCKYVTTTERATETR